MSRFLPRWQKDFITDCLICPEKYLIHDKKKDPFIHSLAACLSRPLCLHPCIAIGPSVTKAKSAATVNWSQKRMFKKVSRSNDGFYLLSVVKHLRHSCTWFSLTILVFFLMLQNMRKTEDRIHRRKTILFNITKKNSLSIEM